MITVSSTVFSKNFGRYRELVQREPLAVTSHDRVTGYFVSTEEYEEYLRVKQLMPKAYAVEELSEDTIMALANSKMHKRYTHLNKLLD